ncbi:hypothetical protein [Actinoplanes sp. NPDC026623]|uniref:hypothetical protein n=1 Tax=Actinoplanes sp. NPDC026623 TaxID=3155610 RepID=UPI0033F75337
MVGHDGSTPHDLVPAVAALAGRPEDHLGRRADDDLRTRVAAPARTVLNRVLASCPDLGRTRR